MQQRLRLYRKSKNSLFLNKKSILLFFIYHFKKVKFMFYQVKVKYLVPKEGSDEMEKKTKAFLVEGISISEVEGKITGWFPANWQDPIVKGCAESNIIEIKSENDSEDWWEATLGDENEKGKLVPFHVAISGSNHLEVIKKLDTLYSTSEFIGIKKLNTVVDDDLIDPAYNPLTSKKKEESKDELYADVDEDESPF